jgi:hypothetical protein
VAGSRCSPPSIRAQPACSCRPSTSHYPST